MDQMQPNFDTTAGGFAIGGPSQQKLAQTVTVGRDGSLLGIYLPIIGCSSGALVIEIRELYGDEPGDVLLSQRQISAYQIPGIGPVFRYFWIGGFIPFSAGDRFAIVLKNPTGSCAIYRSPVGNSYSEGEGFFDSLPNQQGWIPLTNSLDIPFMTMMMLP